MKDDHRSNPVLDTLQQAMKGKSFPTREAAQQFVDAFMQEKNARANDDFCGLSPDLILPPFFVVLNSKG